MVESTRIPAKTSELLELLEASGLLSVRQISKVQEKFGLTHDLGAEGVARRLVRERVLTPFQAERLLEGRYRGFLIDRYRVREVLGVGGMGCVFIAEDPYLRTKIALKVLASHHATDAGMLARMKLEAWAGMKIQHPSVVRTLRLDSTGAVTFLVMELIRGITLHELVALGGPVKPVMACDMFCQAALGLHAAHEKNIIHRDIKPANLLIDRTGHTWVLDFGLALVGDDSAAEFSLAMIFGHDCLGTPDYIAPEQSVDSNPVDARADVYSLGCTMYVALTGRVPFADQKSSWAKINAQRTMTPPPVDKVNPAVPADVAGVLQKMMARDPQDRFASAAEVAEVLEPLSERRKVSFDFRRLVTIRAKQARERELREDRRRTGPPSYITSTFSWVDHPSHHIAAEVDTFTANETPSIHQSDRRKMRLAPSVANLPDIVTASSGRRSSVPAGWYLESLEDGRQTPLNVVRIRIGTAAECHVRPAGMACDKRQCTLEFDGEHWNIKQESRNFPTFVDGELHSRSRLGTGTELTFNDGTGYLIGHHPPNDAASRRRRIRLVAGSILILFGAVVVAACILMR